MMRNKKRAVLLALLALVLCLAPVIAYVSEAGGEAAQTPDPQAQVTMLQSEYDSLSRFDRMDEIKNLLEEHYYGEVDEEELMDSAKYNIFVPLNDDYTYYYSVEAMESQAEKLEGQYAGIGLQLLGDMSDETINIVRVFKDSPAEKAGILRGDIIVEVNGESYNALTMNEAVDNMRGEPGTEVTVVVERKTGEGGEPERLEFTLPRQIVVMDSASYEILDGDIGYVLLYDFMGTDVAGFFEAIEYFVENNVKGLIIDVRDNRGGLVSDAVTIADALMPEGLIVYTEDRYGYREESWSDSQSLGWPIVILVNDFSASASEILAGALQDSGVGTVVGITTFGKGVVQQMIPLTEEGEGMQFTISSYYTPSGKSIHGVGVEPDIVVEQPEDVKGLGTNVEYEQDVQLQKAVEVLRKKMAGEPLEEGPPAAAESPSPMESNK